jgi:glucose/arabinose dehydrogenase
MKRRAAPPAAGDGAVPIIRSCREQVTGIPRSRRLGALLATALLGVSACAPAPSTAPASANATATPGAATSPSATTSAAPPSPAASPNPNADAAIQVVATGLSTPVGLVAAPDGSGRLFIVEQTGRIWILREDGIENQPFLDLSDRLVPLDPTYDERGLLGLAFDPDFASSGRFFVYYSAPNRDGAAAGSDHTNTLSEIRVSGDDLNRADPATERVILQFEQPQPNHSGGGLGFGPDGDLYLGTGDGGGTGDDDPGHSAQGNAQDRTKLNGKILRLDVSGAGSGRAYRIPADNPFADGGGRPEIYAYGFRNPWRLAWEPAGARRLLVSDVGYGRFEEIDVVRKGGNYGWRVREGAHCLNVEFLSSTSTRATSWTIAASDSGTRRSSTPTRRSASPWSVATCTEAPRSPSFAAATSSPTSRVTSPTSSRATARS